MVKVVWKNDTGEEATWEVESQIKERYLLSLRNRNFGDEIFVEGRIVTS